MTDRELLEQLVGDVATIKADVTTIKADVATIKADVTTIKSVQPIDQEAKNIATVRRATGRSSPGATPMAAKGGQ